ncbi:MAG TPA: TetR/AcrR family transcriptional regulator [Caulobacterales bacterium]|nr:TetR/AcrR family transcriptional regulator [Caulobacterales bacterium]
MSDALPRDQSDAAPDANDPRVQRTRQALVRALTELIADKGYDAITIAELVERAKVKRSTFYVHFRDKGELFSYAIAERGEHIRGVIEPLSIAASISAEAVFAAWVDIYRYLQQDASFFAAALCNVNASAQAEALFSRFAMHAIEQISEAAHEKDRDDPLQVEASAHFVAGGVLALWRWWLARGAQETPQDMALRTLRVLSEGVYRYFGGESQSLDKLAETFLRERRGGRGDGKRRGSS